MDVIAVASVHSVRNVVGHFRVPYDRTKASAESASVMERSCKICDGWHDLDQAWPAQCLGHWKRTNSSCGLQIIKDIEPYKTVAAEKATGKQIRIGSRREHKEFLRRNGYEEIGNDIPKPKRPELNFVSKADIKQAIEQVKAGKGYRPNDNGKAYNIFGGIK